MTRTRLSIFAVLVAAASVFSARPAFAGPPLLCFPFQIGHARTLPMGADGWRSVDPAYDASHLVADTIALLGADTPVIVRMETLRRATVYAAVNPTMGPALLSAVQARANASTPDAALSMFDLGYLVETYKQAAFMFGPGVLQSADTIDGYALVQKAMTFRQDPQIEFAQAVISASPKRAEYPEHVRKAEAAAKADPLLASNLASRF